MSTEATHRSLSTYRKKRGVVRASITRIHNRLTELERSASEEPSSLDVARRLSTRLETLDQEFKLHHYTLIELLEEEALRKEQDLLDDHDYEVADLSTRFQKLIDAHSSLVSGQHKIVRKRLNRLDEALMSIGGTISSIYSVDDEVFCLLQQLEEQLAEYKRELCDVCSDLLSLDIEDSSSLNILEARIEKGIFNHSLQIKKLLRSQASSLSTSDVKGVKLPKLETPTFDGDILNWSTFWEQFDISVHSRTNISDSEKLAYLCNALKNGTAGSVIEGLSRSGKHYKKAVACLKARYNCPRLIHQAHTQKILDIPKLKDGHGKELRRLHDTALQHLRALKAMGHEPSGSFITSMLELKLDANTMFEWQRDSQDCVDVPHYQKLLDFINLRAQAAEATSDSSKKPSKANAYPTKNHPSSKPVTSFAVNVDSTGNCIICKSERHPLFACTKFKALSHSDKLTTLKSNKHCLNCLRPGHFVKNCKSLHRCRVCQRPHHTLLHLDEKDTNSSPPPTVAAPTISEKPAAAAPISACSAIGIKSDLLLMTCQVVVEAPNGSSVEARALLDPGSSASFVSERLAQSLQMSRSSYNTRISGVAGFARNSSQPITTFSVLSCYLPSKKFSVSAVIVPQVTCDLPLHPVPFNQRWNHLSNIQLADSSFGKPGKIDLLLGMEIFAEVVLDGRQSGVPESPVAFETQFGWVLAGATGSCNPSPVVTMHHVSVLSGDDLLCRFWEVEERVQAEDLVTPEERMVLDHFKDHHTRQEDGRFVVPLLKKPEVKPLGESRSQAVRRFLSFERALHSKGKFQEFKTVIDEYFTDGHAERVPPTDLEKPSHSVFYLPIHAVRKDSSITTKLRAVFDASAKTSSGVSLNDTLLIGPTVHSSLVDVLLRFRLHRIALVADVSRMYRAVVLSMCDRDLHRFVWRNSPNEPLVDYRMTRLTFGVSASSFIANMCVKQNALDHMSDLPLAARAVEESFYVDDGLTGADSIKEAVELHCQLQDLFGRGGFLLRKWNSSEASVLHQIDPEL